jgi:hypothetical protein
LAFEVVETGARHDGRGRRLESALERERLLERYDASGLTQKAFAEREGINYHTFVAWLGRRRRAEDSPATSPKMDFAEFQLPGPRSWSGGLEVCLADGTVVRGADASEVAALVKALRN